MANDDYKYQSQPLPPASIPGSDALGPSEYGTQPARGGETTAFPTSSPFTGPGGGSGGGGGSGFVLAVSNVTWDSVAGNLVIDFTDGSQTTIAFSDCPV